MRKRARLIRELQQHVRSNHKLPKSQRPLINPWLDKLNAYANSLDEMRTVFREASGPGDDMLLALSAAVVKEKALATRGPAMSLGLESCTHVKKWEKIGK